MIWVQIRPGMFHRGDCVGGSVIQVDEGELEAFGDKFIVLPVEPIEPIEPEEPVEVEEVEPESPPQAKVKVNATPEALALALASGWTEQDVAEIEGNGKDGRVLRNDVLTALEEAE